MEKNLSNQQSKRNELVIENSIKLDATDPVPFKFGSGSSIFSYSVAGKRYIPFLGGLDNMPTIFKEARLTSTTQNACVTTIVESLIGKGLYIKNEKELIKEVDEFFKCVNNDSNSMDEIVTSCADGYLEQGNHFIEIVRGTFGNKKFIKVYEHSIMFCRVGKVDCETGEVKTVIISKSFPRNGYIPKSKGEKEIPLYNTNALNDSDNWTKEEGGLQRTMLHFKNKVNGIDFYGLPPSVSGLRYQVLEGKSAQYNIDLFDNNMVLGGMLILKGAMTQEEAQKNAKRILLSHVGEGKTGRIAVISSEQGLDDVEWKPYETQKEGSFIELDKRIEEKIVAANGWDKRLAGLDRDAGLSNGDGSLSNIYDAKETSLLKPLRKKLIDKVLEPIMKIWSDWGGIKLDGKEFDFKVQLPLSFYGKTDPNAYIKVKEARQAANLEPDTVNGEKFLAEIKPAKDVQPK